MRIKRRYRVKLISGKVVYNHREVVFTGTRLSVHKLNWLPRSNRSCPLVSNHQWQLDESKSFGTDRQFSIHYIGGEIAFINRICSFKSTNLKYVAFCSFVVCMYPLLTERSTLHMDISKHTFMFFFCQFINLFRLLLDLVCQQFLA